MKEIIATIRLAGGQVGFYDKLTGIYLTQTQPVAHLYAGMNLNQIRKSLKSKRILLVSGSVDNSSLPILQKIEKKIESKTEQKNETAVKQADPIIESGTVPVAEQTVAETIIEEPVATQEAVSNKRRKRKAAEKTEEVVVSSIKMEE